MGWGCPTELADSLERAMECFRSLRIPRGFPWATRGNPDTSDRAFTAVIVISITLFTIEKWKTFWQSFEWMGLLRSRQLVPLMMRDVCFTWVRGNICRDSSCDKATTVFHKKEMSQNFFSKVRENSSCKEWQLCQYPFLLLMQCKSHLGDI
jgi:hypothetical protein